MELSDNTVSVLKNYASINPNVVLSEGTTIKTISEGRNVISSATLDTPFPQTVGIYDLHEFLQVLDLVEKPRLKFEDSYLTVIDSTGRSHVRYYYSSLDILTKPSKDIAMPEPEVSFDLDRSTFVKILKASSALGHENVLVRCKNKIVSLSVIDSSDPSSNTYTIDVEGSYEDTVPEDHVFIFAIKNWKMIDGDYRVELSTKNISHFVNKNLPVEYWVAIESNKTNGV